MNLMAVDGIVVATGAHASGSIALTSLDISCGKSNNRSDQGTGEDDVGEHDDSCWGSIRKLALLDYSLTEAIV